LTDNPPGKSDQQCRILLFKEIRFDQQSVFRGKKKRFVFEAMEGEWVIFIVVGGLIVIVCDWASQPVIRRRK
jgi:hypothetical protein